MAPLPAVAQATLPLAAPHARMTSPNRPQAVPGGAARLACPPR
jgi:hypothetical protein